MKTSFSFVRRHSSLTLVIFGGLLASLGDAVAATQNFASVNKILVPGQAPVYDVQFRDADVANDVRLSDDLERERRNERRTLEFFDHFWIAATKLLQSTMSTMQIGSIYLPSTTTTTFSYLILLLLTTFPRCKISKFVFARICWMRAAATAAASNILLEKYFCIVWLNQVFWY